jgi:UPF0755 protein
MVERPPRVRHYGRRPRPSRRQLLIRRALAAGLLVGAFAVLIGLAAAALGRGDGNDPPAASTSAPARLKTCNIAFPEGFAIRDMAAKVARIGRLAKKECGFTPRLTKAGYLAAVKNAAVPVALGAGAAPKGLEGFLFPATYQFDERTTSKAIVAEQLKTFKRNWSKVNLAYAKTKQLTSYDVLIIASMVEKETLAPDERPLVAAVIYNRLKAGMSLGIDATIRYGLNIPGTESLRESQLQNDSPYNTRIHAGLTPTPIGNPGLASMQAAAHPAKVDYLFFVRKPDKVHHFFTASESEFYAKACEYGFSCG